MHQNEYPCFIIAIKHGYRCFIYPYFTSLTCCTTVWKAYIERMSFGLAEGSTDLDPWWQPYFIVNKTLLVSFFMYRDRFRIYLHLIHIFLKMVYFPTICSIFISKIIKIDTCIKLHILQLFQFYIVQILYNTTTAFKPYFCNILKKNITLTGCKIESTLL